MDVQEAAFPFLELPYTLQCEIVKKMKLQPVLKFKQTCKYGAYLVSKCKTKILDLYRVHFENRTKLRSLWNSDGGFAVVTMELARFMEYFISDGLHQLLSENDQTVLQGMYRQVQEELTVWEEFHEMERPPLAIHYRQMAKRLGREIESDEDEEVERIILRRRRILQRRGRVTKRSFRIRRVM